MIIRVQNGDKLKILPFISNGEVVFYKEVDKYHLQQRMYFSTIYDKNDILKKLYYLNRQTNANKFVKYSKQWLFDWQMMVGVLKYLVLEIIENY